MNALETELVGVTIPKRHIEQIDALLEKLNTHVIMESQKQNRQDFIRMAIAEKLAQQVPNGPKEAV